jgi:hypothetical protein
MATGILEVRQGCATRGPLAYSPNRPEDQSVGMSVQVSQHTIRRTDSYSITNTLARGNKFIVDKKAARWELTHNAPLASWT